jgi:hypothetical protein
MLSLSKHEACPPFDRLRVTHNLWKDLIKSHPELVEGWFLFILLLVNLLEFSTLFSQVMPPPSSWPTSSYTTPHHRANCV